MLRKLAALDKQINVERRVGKKCVLGQHKFLNRKFVPNVVGK
jgi:hypothetical protein